MTTIFDLPAHPLFVHVPVVLLPLLAIVTMVAAVRPSVAQRLGVWLPIASLLVFVSVLLAVNTGEALDKAQNLGNVKHHRALAETTRLLSLVLLVATIALWWVTRRRVTTSVVDRQRPLAKGVAAVTVVFAVLSAVWVIRTGHEGARVHWSGVLKTK